MTYVGKILVLRIVSREPWNIEIEVVEPRSEEHESLITLSEQVGELGETKPGKTNSRHWGLF